MPQPFAQPIEPAAGLQAAPAVDASVASSARIWNYWLGGKDNYAVDRRVGDEIVRGYPQIVSLARYSRAFLGRAISYLAGEAGVRQFLDIGAGLPAADNVHEMARRAHPDCRVVYVDNDPVVLAHLRARLVDPTDELVDVVGADLARPEQILRAAGGHLDLQRPVAVILANVLGHLPNFGSVRATVRRLLWPLSAGSHLVVVENTNVVDGPAIEAALQFWNEVGSAAYQPRTPAEIEQLFDGLTLVEPGVVTCPHWRPFILAPDPVDEFCGVGRKPG